MILGKASRVGGRDARDAAPPLLFQQGLSVVVYNFDPSIEEAKVVVVVHSAQWQTWDTEPLLID